MYDSNVFRLPKSEDAESTAIFQYGAGLDAAIPISQQLLDLNLSAVRNHFASYDSFDYTDIDTLARWRWRVGNLWSGNAILTYRHDIAPLEEIQAPVKDIRNYYDASLSALRSLSAHWAIDFAVGRDDLRHELDSRQPLDHDVDRASVEFRHSGSSADSYLGLRATERWARFPNREPVAQSLIDNSHKEQDYSLTLNWQASEKSLLTGDLGYSILRHEEFLQRDFSGPTGSLTYRYQANEGSGVELSAWRDLSVWTETTASYMSEVGLHVRPFWQYSYRISFQADLSALQRQFLGDPLLTVNRLPTRRDSVATGGLSATYAQFDNLRYELSYRTEVRDSNRDEKDYQYDVIGLNVQASF